jgi:hypothetical protein
MLGPSVGEHILREVNIVSNPLKVNTTYCKEISPMREFERTEKGGYCFRALRLNQANGKLVACLGQDIGIVCFCNEEIPAEYTHFVIDRIIRDGKVCIVIPQCGDIQELLDSFVAPGEKEDQLRKIAQTYFTSRPEKVGELLLEIFSKNPVLVEYSKDLAVAIPIVCEKIAEIEHTLKVLPDPSSRLQKVRNKANQVRSDLMLLLKN